MDLDDRQGLIARSAMQQKKVSPVSPTSSLRSMEPGDLFFVFVWFVFFSLPLFVFVFVFLFLVASPGFQGSARFQSLPLSSKRVVAYKASPLVRLCAKKSRLRRERRIFQEHEKSVRSRILMD